MDRRIGRTSSFFCDYFEWSGWYNSSVSIRLLGHYRLFQLYKKYNNVGGVPAENAYILYYRENRQLKDSWPQQLIPFLRPFFITIKAEVQSINHTLLFKRTDILQNFLFAADNNFDQALLDALEHISNPAFLSESPITNVQLEIHQNHQYHTSLSKNEFHVHPVVREQTATEKQTKGKEEGVFSKKQVLLFFDLLARDKKLEPIDFRKPKKFKDIAPLLRALTGRGEETWIAELNDYRHKELYAFSSDGERQELIRILINLAEKFRLAGLESVAKLADKKIIELEHAAP